MLSYILNEFQSFIPDAQLEVIILRHNPITSNVLPPAPLDEFLSGDFKENHKYSQMQEDKLLQKNAAKAIKCSGSSVKNLTEN